MNNVPKDKLFAHLFYLDWLSFVSKGGVTGNHKKFRDFGKGGDNVLGDPIAKELLFGVPAHVDKGQHGDGGFVRQGKGHFLFRGHLGSGRSWVQDELPDNNRSTQYQEDSDGP